MRHWHHLLRLVGLLLEMERVSSVCTRVAARLICLWQLLVAELIRNELLLSMLLLKLLLRKRIIFLAGRLHGWRDLVLEVTIRLFIHLFNLEMLWTWRYMALIANIKDFIDKLFKVSILAKFLHYSKKAPSG